MSREILFRGKIVGTGKWVEGELMGGQIHVKTSYPDEWWGYEVIPESVGQFIGLLGKNKVKIFEGDVLQTTNLENKLRVLWSKHLASFALQSKGWMYDHYFGEAVDAGRCEVIGNIFDNPELKGKEADNG